MVIFGCVFAIIRALSISFHYRNVDGNIELDINFKGVKAMAGLIMIVTGFKVGAGLWRGKLRRA